MMSLSPSLYRRLATGLAMSAALFATACSPDGGGIAYDRPDLLARANDGVQHELRTADRHILVVRHARKVSPDCNALDCQLSEQGEAMVAQLSTVLGDTPVGAAYASAACRTSLTAAAGGLDVVPHQALDGYDTGCAAGETVTRQRSDAFAEALDSEVRWTLVGEHSNTVCMWMAEFAGPDAAGEAGCVEGRVPSDAYGHVYWLYRMEGVWRLTVLEGAFEVAAAE